MGVLGSLDIGQRTGDVIRHLCEGPNSYVTAALGERHRTSVVYLAVERSTEDVSLTMHVGARLPLFASAMGRAILVAMPDTALRAILTRSIAPTRPGETPGAHISTKPSRNLPKKAIAPATETDASTSTASPSRSSDPAVNASTGSTSAALRSMWVPPSLKRSTLHA